MAKELFIGIDIGTTYLKVGIYNLNGELFAYSEDELELFNPKKDEFYQKPGEHYKKTLSGIKNCMENKSIHPGEVSAISFSGQMGGIMAVDKYFNPVINYDIILDKRAEKYSELLNKKNFEFVYKRTGCVSTYGGKIIYWSKNKEVSGKIFKFIQPADYVSGKMCGLASKDIFYGFFLSVLVGIM